MKKKLIIVSFAIILILLNIAIVAAQSQEINNDQEVNNDKVNQLTGTEITAIEIEGNKTIKEQQILEQIETEEGAEVDPEQLKRDLQAIFDLGHFFDVQVLFDNQESGVKLIFEVVENPEIKEIKVRGNNQLSNSEVKEILSINTPQVLNVNQLDAGIKKVNEYYEEQGYILASVTDVTIKNNHQLQLTVNEGYVKQINITGNEKTKEYVITREMTTGAGDVLNIKKLREDISNIYRLGYFKNVTPNLERVNNSQLANVNIEVDEQQTGNFNIGIGYSSTSKFTGMINIKKDNLGGRGQRVNLNWEFGGEKNNFEIGFYEPWTLGTKTSLDFNLYDRNETTEDDVDVSREGGSVTLGRPLTDDIQGYLEFDYSTLKENNPDGEDSSDNTTSLTFRSIRDTKDDFLNPRSGGRQEISVKKSGFWGTTDYSKYKLDWREYFASGEKNSIAARFKVASSAGDLPSSERYYLSALDAVRGYNQDYYKSQDTTGDGTEDYIPEENGFIGDSLMLFNLEYRAKLLDNITGVAFLDAGNAFKKDDFDVEDFNYSVGLGFRFNTPVGQLGLDYGYAPEGKLEEKSDFSISLGNKF
ncbi:MAG: BamA/OMP85 family outer membrane protein [Bacillota bacterium]